MDVRRRGRAALIRTRQAASSTSRPVRIELDRLASRRGRAGVAVFHEFRPAPTGGGSQFLRALVGELARRGVDVEVDRISGRTPVCLYNSFNFDFDRLRRFARADCRMVHRVDGPIGVGRGYDDGTDRRIVQINHAFANATVFQSSYSLEKHRELGLELRDPAVIPNAVDPAIFHSQAEREPLEGRRVRVVATSWSDNPSKGSETLLWLDRNLDHDRYDVTFAGRAPFAFERIRTIGPMPSRELADLLRTQDVYVAPSMHEACSNAVLEALACGLPVAYVRSGGHPELVGEGGLPFDSPEEVPEVLDRLASELDERRAAISILSLAEVTDRYLAVLTAP